MGKNKLIFVLIILLFCIFGKNICAEEPFKYDSKGKRDPFVPLFSGKSKVSAGLDGVEVPEDINLEGIVIDNANESFAIMNGIVVKDNSEAGNVFIKQIKTKSVIVIINDIEYEVYLKEGENKIDDKTN